MELNCAETNWQNTGKKEASELHRMGAKDVL